MKKSWYTVVFFLFVTAGNASAKIYMWVGGPQKQEMYWNNPSSWNSPGDGSYPGAKEDTAQFTALAKSGCVLNTDVEIKCIQCLPGFAKVFHFYKNKLSVSGDADFSNGKIVPAKGHLIFTGAKGEKQTFKPREGVEFTDIQMTGQGTLEVTGAPLKAGALNVNSGTWCWSAGTHTVMKDFVIRGKATMVFRNNVMLNIAAAYANFGEMGTIDFGTRDTLCFSAQDDTQLFNPKRGVFFPPIKKTNKGTVTLTSAPLNARSLVIEGGIWNWATGLLPDTIASISTGGGISTMIFGNRTLKITEGDVDLIGIAKLTPNSGVIDFIGDKDQYFTPALSANPEIRHSGPGLLFHGSREDSRAVMDKSSYKMPVFFASEKVMIRSKVLSFELGMNLYGQPFTSFSREDTIGRMGVAFGVLIPIRVPKVLLWYHVRALFHGTESRKNGGRKYWSGVNEVLAGKPLLVKYLPFEYTPIAGLGLTEGIIIQKNLSAFYLNESHPFLFTNLGLLIRNRTEQNDGASLHGVLFTWERGFFGAIDSKMRFGFTAVYGF